MKPTINTLAKRVTDAYRQLERALRQLTTRDKTVGLGAVQHCTLSLQDLRKELEVPADRKH